MIDFKIVLLFINVFTVFVKAYNITNEHDAVMYLNRFGYLNDEDVTDKTGMTDAKPMLKEFQRMCNIKQTGALDSKTMEMMNAPRCGNYDMNQTEHHTMFMGEHRDNEVIRRRFRRFAINEQNLLWKKRELTYKMGMFVKTKSFHVTEDIVLKEIRRAFTLWSEVTNLDFIYAPKHSKVDIELSFTERFHNQDNFPFDGPGKTLAHAFPPGQGVLGDVHFENEENWTSGSPKGTDVLFVAVHEIGHALGLSHSMEKGAIMQPFYPGYIQKLKLHPDDIAGVQLMYGKREKKSHASHHFQKSEKSSEHQSSLSPTNQPPIKTAGDFGTNGRRELCEDAKIDAVTTLKDGSVYAFKGNSVFQIDSKGKGVLTGWPKRIDSLFKGLEGNLDAVLTRKNGKTYFFKGQYYWRSEGAKMHQGYPKKISVGFNGIPDHVDSAFEWHNAMYFTKGNKIWRFDPMSKPFVSEKYPLPLKVWGLGDTISRIDASFKAPNGKVYFFSGQTYWRFDDRKFKVDDANPPYPRSSKAMWFGCTGGASDNRDIRQLTPDPIIYNNLLEYNDY